jgi:hypothetical protein
MRLRPPGVSLRRSGPRVARVATAWARVLPAGNTEGEGRSEPDSAALEAAEQFRRLAGLIAVELGADPELREPVLRAVEDAMTGHLPT